MSEICLIEPMKLLSFKIVITNFHLFLSFALAYRSIDTDSDRPLDMIDVAPNFMDMQECMKRKQHSIEEASPTEKRS